MEIDPVSLDLLEKSRAFRQEFLQFEDTHELIRHSVKVVAQTCDVQSCSIFLFNKLGLLKRVAIYSIDPAGNSIPASSWIEEAYSVNKDIEDSEELLVFTAQVVKPKNENSYYGSFQMIREEDEESLNRDSSQKIALYRSMLGSFRSAICIPLDGQNRTYGVLEVVNKISSSPRKVGQFLQDDIDKLSNLSNSISTGFSLARYKMRQKTLRDLNQQLMSASDRYLYPDLKYKIFQKKYLESDEEILFRDVFLSDRFRSFLEKCLVSGVVEAPTSYDAAVLRLAIGNSLVVIAQSGIPRIKWNTRDNTDRDIRKQGVDTGFAGQVFNTKKRLTFIISEEKRSEFKNKRWIDENYFKAFGCFPLMLQEKVVGTLSLFSSYEYKYHPSSINFVETVASTIASFIARVELELIELKFQCAFEYAPLLSPDQNLEKAGSVTQKVSGASLIRIKEEIGTDRRKKRTQKLILKSSATKQDTKKFLVELERIQKDSSKVIIETLPTHGEDRVVFVIPNDEQANVRKAAIISNSILERAMRRGWHAG